MINEILTTFENQLMTWSITLRSRLTSDTFYGYTSGVVSGSLGEYTYNSRDELNTLYQNAVDLFNTSTSDIQVSWASRKAMCVKYIDNLKLAGKFEFDSETSNTKSVQYRQLAAFISYIKMCDEQIAAESLANDTSFLIQAVGYNNV